MSLLCYDEEEEILWLALRIFFIGTKQGSDLTTLMNDPDVYESLSGNRNCVDAPYPNDYFAILNLFRQGFNDPSSSSRTEEDVQFLARVNLQKIQMVCGMIHALRRVGFFTDGLVSAKV